MKEYETRLNDEVEHEDGDKDDEVEDAKEDETTSDDKDGEANAVLQEEVKEDETTSNADLAAENDDEVGEENAVS